MQKCYKKGIDKIGRYLYNKDKKRRCTEAKGDKKMTLKKMLEELETAEAKTDRIDEAWENDYENEELEKAYMEAYKEEHKAFETLVNEIVKVSCGAIDNKTARMVLIAKRDEVKSLIARIA